MLRWAKSLKRDSYVIIWDYSFDMNQGPCEEECEAKTEGNLVYELWSLDLLHCQHSSTCANRPLLCELLALFHCFRISWIRSNQSRRETGLTKKSGKRRETKEAEKRGQAPHCNLFVKALIFFVFNMLWSLNPYFSNVLQIGTFFCNGISRHFLYLIFYK